MVSAREMEQGRWEPAASSTAMAVRHRVDLMDDRAEMKTNSELDGPSKESKKDPIRFIGIRPKP